MSNINELLWVTNTHITEGQYPIHGLYRVEPYSENDSGWRVVSEYDEPEFVNNPMNIVTLTFTEMLEMEPGLNKIVNLPVGTELELIQHETDVSFVDYNTKKPVA